MTDTPTTRALACLRAGDRTEAAAHLDGQADALLVAVRDLLRAGQASLALWMLDGATTAEPAQAPEPEPYSMGLDREDAS